VHYKLIYHKNKTKMPEFIFECNKKEGGSYMQKVPLSNYKTIIATNIASNTPMFNINECNSTISATCGNTMKSIVLKHGYYFIDRAQNTKPNNIITELNQKFLDPENGFGENSPTFEYDICSDRIEVTTKKDYQFTFGNLNNQTARTFGFKAGENFAQNSKKLASNHYSGLYTKWIDVKSTSLNQVKDSIDICRVYLQKPTENGLFALNLVGSEILCNKAEYTTMLELSFHDVDGEIINWSIPDVDKKYPTNTGLRITFNATL
jgi:hypothetical protein